MSAGATEALPILSGRRRKAALAVWAAGVAAGTVLLLCTLPFPLRQTFFFGLLPADKLAHVALFTLIAAPVLVLFRARDAALLAVAVLLALALGTEPLQMLTPARRFSQMDLLANVLGCLLGGTAGLALRRQTGKTCPPPA